MLSWMNIEQQTFFPSETSKDHIKTIKIAVHLNLLISGNAITCTYNISHSKHFSEPLFPRVGKKSKPL